MRSGAAIPDISALIVDDEPAARSGLRRMLAAHSAITVVGEARNGAEAVELIREHRPQVVFLDVQMPEINGFQVLEALTPEEVPVIVFVTAYDAWAVRAFEVRAFDYLLKPFDDRRLVSVVERLSAHFAEQGPDDMLERIQSLLSARRQSDSFITRLVVREAGAIRFISVEDVEWIEAADYYARVHTNKSSELVRYTLNDLEKQLDPMRFVRVHRSAIVNASRVKEIRIAHQTHHTAILTNGASVPVSRSKKDVLEKVLTGGGSR
jgi:two-component system LytT family response regulator